MIRCLIIHPQRKFIFLRVAWIQVDSSELSIEMFKSMQYPVKLSETKSIVFVGQLVL